MSQATGTPGGGLQLQGSRQASQVKLSLSGAASLSHAWAKRLDLVRRTIVEVLLHDILHHQLVHADPQHIRCSEGLGLVIAEHDRNALHGAIHVQATRPEITCSCLLQSPVRVSCSPFRSSSIARPKTQHHLVLMNMKCYFSSLSGCFHN